MKNEKWCSLKKKVVKGFSIAMLSAAIVSSTVAPVSAAGEIRNYTAYSLPKLKGNKYTPVHPKVTNRNYVHNTVTATTNASYVNSWVINDGKKKISKKYKLGVGTGKARMDITKDGYNRKDVQIGVGFENASSTSSYGFVSGYLNLY